MAIQIEDSLSPMGLFPIVESDHIVGGYRSVETIDDRNNIPTLRRKFGMMVYVMETDKLYVLESVNSSNLADNTNWVEKG